MDDCFRTFEVEPETYFGQSGADHRMAQFGFVVGVKHQKAAAARANQLAADRAVLDREFIPLVDLGVRHAAGTPLFVLPMLVHQLAEFDELTAFQRFEAA